MNRKKKEMRSGNKRFRKEKLHRSFLENIAGSRYSYLIIAVLILLIYWPVFSFIIGKFDEKSIIVSNMNFLLNFSNLKQALMRDALISDQGIAFYRPLQNLSFMIDAHLSGMSGWAYYLDNTVIHILSCFLLFYLLRLILERPTEAFLLTMVFAANPLFVQAVAWAPSRGDLLIGMFGLLSLVSFIRYLRSGKMLFLIIHAVSFAMALFSKETAILFPAVFLSFYFFVEKEEKRSLQSLVIPLFIYLITIGCYFCLREWVVRVPLSRDEFGIFPFLHNIRSVAEYLGKFFLPLSLAPMPWYTVLNTSTGILVFLTLIYLMCRYHSNNRIILVFGIGWYLLFLLPGMMYSHQFGKAAYDYLEHRAYLPLMGIIIFLFVLWGGQQDHHRYKMLPQITIALVLVYGIWSRIYLKNYETPATYYDLSISTNPYSALALNDRGSLRYENQNFTGATEDFEKALKIRKDYAEAYVNLGTCKYAMKDYPGALADFNQATRFNATLFQAHLNKGNTFNQMGHPEKALNEFNAVLKLNPSFWQGYQLRGEIKAVLKEYDNALKDLTRSIVLNPQNSRAYYVRGKVNYMMGQNKKACEDWNNASRLGLQDAERLVYKYCR
jgi:tetratricopeptide (TPR) repeat protein